MIWQYEEGRIFCMENDEVIAETTYVHKDNGEVDIDHTYISPKLRGQGAAGEMMKVVAEYLKENGLKASASCSYANSWLKKHMDTFGDIVSADIENDAAACKIGGRH